MFTSLLWGSEMPEIGRKWNTSSALGEERVPTGPWAGRVLETLWSSLSAAWRSCVLTRYMQAEASGSAHTGKSEPCPPCLQARNSPPPPSGMLGLGRGHPAECWGLGDVGSCSLSTCSGCLPTPTASCTCTWAPRLLSTPQGLSAFSPSCAEAVAQALRCPFAPELRGVNTQESFGIYDDIIVSCMLVLGDLETSVLLGFLEFLWKFLYTYFSN